MRFLMKFFYANIIFLEIECWLMILILGFSHGLLRGTPPTNYLYLYFWLEYGSTFLLKCFGFALGYLPFSKVTEKYQYTITIIGYIISLCFCAVSLYLVIYPLTEEDMSLHAQSYYEAYNEVLPFLDNFQQKFSCCGVNSYKDYFLNGTMPYPGETVVKINRTVKVYYSTPRPINNTDPSISYPHNVTTQHAAFNVPPTCCPFGEYLSSRRNTCGMGIIFNKDEDKKINNKTRGCYSMLRFLLDNVNECTALADCWIYNMQEFIPIAKFAHATIVLFFFLYLYYKEVIPTRVGPAPVDDDDELVETEDEQRQKERAEYIVPVDAVALGVHPQDPLVQMDHPDIYIQQEGNVHEGNSDYSYSDEEDYLPYL